MRDEIKLKIDSAILFLYQNLFRTPVFPIEPLKVVCRLEKCRCLSYEELAAHSGASMAEIIRAFNSSDGSTHYDPSADRYLMALNMSGRSGARIRWTTAHELGHIAAGHFQELSDAGLLEASSEMLPQMEEEADYFAASFLAPIPALRALRVKSAADIRDWFGLSQTAAEKRFAEYNKGEEPSQIDEFFAEHRPKSSVKSATVRVIRGIDVD